jgi:RES domain
MRIYAPRIHTPPRNALWFGPAPGRLPIHRFDDPDGRFRVCYLATTVEVCFAETFLRNPPVRILSLEDLGRRSIATVEVRRELRLVPIQGPGLVRLGVTAELASGGDYGYSQLWSRALWEHPNKPDGILYRSRHDDSALCAAVFNRAKNSLAVIRDESLTKDTQQLARLLKRYGVVLTS